MAPPKSKLTVAERKERNKQYCKKYRQIHRDQYRKVDSQKKAYERMKLKVMKPEVYELKKAEDRERAKQYRLRKKLNLVANEIPVEEQDQSPSSSSFTTKQSLNRSVKKVEKALPFSPRKKTEVIGNLAKKF